MPRDRLQDLLEMSRKTPHKPLVWYGLAMEYRSRGQRAESAAAFERCVAADQTYVPAYFQWGMTLDESHDRPGAIAMLKRGMEAARTKGDSHAASEMGSQLELWGVDVD
jgi:tetratricopeptide (TPR) repeat protein